MTANVRDLDRDRRVVVMTEQGASAGEISLALGITKRTVQRIRVRMGVGQPPARPVTEEEFAAAEVMLKDGASICEVARTLGRDDGAFIRRFPQYKWGRSQVAQSAALGRWFARLA